ncbi:hypothetical protein EYF80_065178 [Liparis tanakae]|uniref:Uncharacterized protein n=1 Tax=Liparis tanakae TaxID=230148 RepID=A0A4Z2E6Z7_9TELE|nr:hypothetical protein EYF80_065178 [Liparis tanakae]
MPTPPAGGVQEQRHPAGAVPPRPHRGPQDEAAGRRGLQVRERAHPGPHQLRDARLLPGAAQVDHQARGLHLLRLPHLRGQRAHPVHARQAPGPEGRQGPEEQQGGLLCGGAAGRRSLPAAGHGLRHHQGQGHAGQGQRRSLAPRGHPEGRPLR